MIDSPLTSSSHPEPFNIDFNDRINFLHTSLLTQLESLPKTTSSLDQIFHLLSIIFRFLRKNLQSHQKLANEYHNLSNTIQKSVSISAQYLHDRHEHENELLFLKDKISQILGQIGYTQYSLEQYWTIIHQLENETERLHILLSNPQLLHINQRKFQIVHETQKIKLDRLMKENQQLEYLIDQQTNSIETIQRQIELDLKELQRLKPIFQKGELEQKDLDQHWLQIEKQTSYLRDIIERSKQMENHYNDRMKTAKIHYDHGQKRLNTLINISDQTNQKLLAIQTNENNIKQEIVNIKNEITQEQTRTLTCRDQIQNLRHQTHELDLIKRYTQHRVKSEEHTNLTLQRQRSILKNSQSKFHPRLENLTEHLTNLIKKTQTNEQTLSLNLINYEDQQSKITAISIAVKNMFDLNNNLDKLLHENRSIRRNEQEKLHSIKQISFQKRKQLLTQRKRLHILSIDEHHLTNRTVRNTLEILRLNNILHNTTTTEKVGNLIPPLIPMIFYLLVFSIDFPEEKTRNNEVKLTEIDWLNLSQFRREKQRASLNRAVHDHGNQIDFLTKKNQLIKNELENKIDHYRILQEKYLKQKHERILISNQKQRSMNSYREKLRTIDETQQKTDQLVKIFDNEINLISKQNQENEQLKLNIHQIKQQIISMMSKNQRQIDECSLLNEKIRLYTQLNDMTQQQCDAFNMINQYTTRIGNLQETNSRLSEHIQNLQKKSMIIISSHHQQRLQKDRLNRMNQTLSHRPVVIRDNPMRIHTDQTFDDYSIYVNRLTRIIHQCTQWREKLTWINQRYLTKIEQIYQQRRLLSTPHPNEMILRYQIDTQMKQCKAMKAEFRLLTIN